MIDEQFLETIPRYGIGGLVKKFFKNVKKVVKKVAPIVGGGIGFMIGGAAGAGIGAGIGGLVAGQSPEEAFNTAMLGYGIGSVAATWGPLSQYAGAGFGSSGAMGMGDKYNVLKGMGFGAGADPVTTSQLYTGTDPVKIKAQNILSNPDAFSIGEVQTANSILNPIAKASSSGLSKGLETFALASIPLSYLDAKAQAEQMGDTDPSALNPFYYQDPQQFQLANVAGSPYYYPELQEQFGVPVEDLPTDFIRSAEGGTVQLADGTRKNFPRKTGPINGPGTGKSDSIPAMLSDGEFVMTAEAVRNAGGGDRRKGAKRMYDTMKNLERRVA